MKRELYTDEYLAWVDGNKKGVAEQLIKYRTELGFSRKKLAEKSGVSVNTIVRIENCNSNSTFSSILNIVNDGLEISIAKFFTHPLMAVKPPKGPIFKNPPQPKKRVTKKRKPK